jgi:hypothetical protein
VLLELQKHVEDRLESAAGQRGLDEKAKRETEDPVTDKSLGVENRGEESNTRGPHERAVPCGSCTDRICMKTCRFVWKTH